MPKLTEPALGLTREMESQALKSMDMVNQLVTATLTEDTMLTQLATMELTVDTTLTLLAMSVLTMPIQVFTGLVIIMPTLLDTEMLTKYYVL